MRTKLDAVRWDGANVREIQAFTGRAPSVVDAVLTVVDATSGDSVRVNVGEWLVRVDRRLHVLPSSPFADDHRASDVDPERVEAVTDALALESGYD